MQLSAYDNDGASRQPVNRRANELVVAADGRIEVSVHGDRYEPVASSTSSSIVGLQANDLTVTLIGTGLVVAIGSVRSDAPGIHTIGLVQRFHRFVAGGEPIAANPHIPNEPPKPVPNGLYLAGVSASQIRYSGACLATVLIDNLQLEIVDHEWSDIFPSFG